jgi:hypothetical protein
MSRPRLQLPRLQLFEFNDLSATPAPLRETIVETLSRALAWGRMMRGLVAPLREFLAAAGTDRVLDLCAGAGGPASILRGEFTRAGLEPPRFTMTDLFPRVDAWAPLAAHGLDYVEEPVDATAIPPSLGAGRARTVINAFHHFPPGLATAIIADAVRSSRGLFISEAFARNPLGFATFGPAGLPALLANPLLARRDRAWKALLTWATPIALAAGLWDGLVSTLRMYTEDELRAMTEAAPGFTWRFGTYDAPFGARGTYFWGVPVS